MALEVCSIAHGEIGASGHELPPGFHREAAHDEHECVFCQHGRVRVDVASSAQLGAPAGQGTGAPPTRRVALLSGESRTRAARGPPAA